MKVDVGVVELRNEDCFRAGNRLKNILALVSGEELMNQNAIKLILNSKIRNQHKFLAFGFETRLRLLDHYFLSISQNSYPRYVPVCSRRLLVSVCLVRLPL